MPQKFDQTIFGAPKGDCFKTCLRMLLESNLEHGQIPNFVDLDRPDYRDWWSEATEFCFKHGMLLQSEEIKTVNGVTWCPDGYWIAAGKNPDGCGHCVVMKGTEMWHDPNPSRRGLKSTDQAWTLINIRLLLRNVFNI